MISGPFLDTQERGEMIERSLRRLSMAQLRSRFRNLFGHSPRNRLGERRNPLIHTLILAKLEPGLRLSIPKRPGPPVKEVVFHILNQEPDMDPDKIVEWVKQECPESQITSKEIPWYRFQQKRLQLPV